MIPRKVQWLAAGAVVVFLTIWLYSRSRDARIRREAVAKAEVAQLKTDRARADSLNALLSDSLRVTHAHTDTVRIMVDTALANYTAQRGKIDTTHASQPLGTPVGFVVVPLSYIQVGDSLAALVPRLTAALDSERAVSSQRIAALVHTDSLNRAIQTRLETEIKAIKPRVSDKLKWALIGGGITLGAHEIFKK